jgi:hypothetical protein
MTTPFQRSHLAALGILAVGLLVFLLVVADFGGSMPSMPSFEAKYVADSLGPSDPRLKELFKPPALARLTLATNLASPFATAYFQPPPPPPPPVKTTRKASLTYNGLFQTATGEKRAYVVVDGTLALLPLGAPVISDLMISNIQRTALSLRRAGTQEVTIPFRSTHEVEVPAQ